MKTELIHTLTDTFEGHAQQSDGGVEFWLARDLQHLLGYTEWRNFTAVIDKARTACEVSGHAIPDHFVGVNKMVDLGSGSQREVDDIMLTRYACYLIAQNGDPKKEEIAFAQTYFAIQTRRAELIEQRLLYREAVSQLSPGSRVRERTLGNGVPLIPPNPEGVPQMIRRDTYVGPPCRTLSGFHVLAPMRYPGCACGLATLGWIVKRLRRNSADGFLRNQLSRHFRQAPTIVLKAKDFATEITIFNAREHRMATETAISREHITNNEAVRNTLLERGIRPETLPAAEDVKRVERRLASEQKKSLQNPEPLDS